MNRTTFILLAGCAWAFAAQAQAQDLVQRLADNAPWTTVSPDGGEISITFRQDGTGRVGSGLFSRRLSWTAEGDRICLSGLPGAASGCMVLMEAVDGLVGLREDGTKLRLWR